MRARISRMGGARGPGAPGGAGEASSQSDADAWRELLRGGEDVAQVMSDMANIVRVAGGGAGSADGSMNHSVPYFPPFCMHARTTHAIQSQLDEISGLEGREEELAVQMAAAAAIAGRVSTLDQSFLVALEFMMGQADANNDSKGRWLLEVVKEQLLSQLQQKMPPQVQVVSLLVATSDKNRRRDIITRALAGGGKLPAEASPGGNMGGMGGMEPPEVHVPGARLEEIIAQADDLVAVSGAGNMGGIGGMEPPEVHVPGARLEEIIAQADDLVASMEEQLPIQDRRLLARLLLAREEARSLMSGGIQDPRNDVRRLKNVPEAEVRFISTLVALRSPELLRKRILDVMEGRQEGEYVKGSDGPIKVQQSKGSAPVRPGHLLDTVTKVLAGMYRTGGSGVTVQQLEWIRKETLDAPSLPSEVLVQPVILGSPPDRHQTAFIRENRHQKHYQQQTITMGSEAGLMTFSAEELDEATNNYSRENSLGRGGFGTGYRGKLADGSAVLVMKLNPDNTRQAAEKFTREVTNLTRADHPHLVKLLGYNPEARCIVYESLPGGTLEDRLLTEGGRKTIQQKHRLRIAAEAAEALLFLHHLDPPILHQDVKPGNVMLNEDLSSKVGGVGLAKFLPANDSSIWGTVGYIDPLLLRTGKYGPQSDLYGLGLVILQLLTGEKVNKVLEFAKFGLDGILDHLDKTVQWNPEIAKEVAEVALKCRDRTNRPDLETVVLPMLKKFAEQTKGEKDADAAPPAGGGGAKGGGGGGTSKGHEKKAAPAAAAAAAPQKKSLFGYFFGKR
ncbi:unnamed protein product [Closterium sp. Yama58-4]|nr:unnamed protein product [Closterium sp. Yama58-4]